MPLLCAASMPCLSGATVESVEQPWDEWGSALLSVDFGSDNGTLSRGEKLQRLRDLFGLIDLTTFRIWSVPDTATGDSLKLRLSQSGTDASLTLTMVRTTAADWRIRNLHHENGQTRWEVWRTGELWAELAMSLAGEHNALNATAAAALALLYQSWPVSGANGGVAAAKFSSAQTKFVAYACP